MNNKLIFSSSISPSTILADKIILAAKECFDGIGFRMSDIQRYFYNGYSIEDLLSALCSNKLEATELHVLRNWLYVTGEDRKKATNNMIRMCEYARNLGVKYICAVGDGEVKNKSIAVDNFKNICDIANDFGVDVAFEFLGWEQISNVTDAWEIVRLADKKNGGLLIDSVHFFTGGSKLLDLDDLPVDKIFLMHISDLLDMGSCDLKKTTRTSRMFPGEGILDLKGLIKKMIEKKYTGPYSLEILSRDLKIMAPEIAIKKGYDSLKKIIDSAKVGYGL